MSNTNPSTIHLNDELKFLIACCQTNPSEKDINFIHTYLSPITNAPSGNALGVHQCPDRKCPWGALITAATQHGILPLVYKTLKKVLQDDSPRSSRNTSHVTRSTLLSELKANYMSIAQRNIMMSAELIKTIKLLKENQIEALAFKGPSLAQMAYGDITLRQYSDLDILVDEDDAYKAGKLMSENGHTAILPLTILSNKTSLHTVKDFSLISEPGGVHTELHWRLFKKKYNISFQSCAMDKKCQTVKINSKEVTTLQNELLLVYLCMHGATHTFERIEWICDIDRFIRSCHVDWEEALAITNQSQSKRSFYLGLSLAHHLFHTPLPSEIIKGINRVKIHTLHTIILKQMTKKHNHLNNFRNHYYHTMLFDTLALKISYLRHHVFTPTKEDYKTISLPPLLYPLYVFIRPFRFFKKIMIKKGK